MGMRTSAGQTTHAGSGGTRAIAAGVLRLSVLLSAGAVPEVAWRHLAETDDPAAGRIAERISSGAPVAEAIEQEARAERPVGRWAGRRRDERRDRAGAWRDVAAAWEIASTVGAPLAEALRGMATALRDAQETLDDVRVAMAEPTHTARLMSALPLIGIVIALALGFDVVGVFTGSAGGAACLVAGVGMILGGRLWAARLIRAARPAPGTPGLEAELMAIALGGGVSLERARRLVAETRAADAAPTARRRARKAPPSGDGEVERVLELSRRAGMPAIELLRATAVQQRHEVRTDGRVRAARLGTRLLVPLGACTLPAFLCLGVMPMLLAVLQSASLPDL
ncbi:MAG: type II secretion system F family protein [Microbacterium sp.]